MYDVSEWDYRAPTLGEAVGQLRRDWDGPRCPHGTPIAHFGPDLICNRCEWEEDEGEGAGAAVEAAPAPAYVDDDLPF